MEVKRLKDLVYGLEFWISFKNRKLDSEVLHDIVTYVLENQDSLDVVQKSSTHSPRHAEFTASIGKLVLLRVYHYRRDASFLNDTQVIADNILNEKYGYLAKRHIKDGIVRFERYLTSRDPENYFLFFAVACELCIRVAGKDDYVSDIIETSKNIMDCHRSTFPGWCKLHSYAEELLQVCTILLKLKYSK